MNYWKANLLILSIILFIWFIVSFGFGIIWSESLDEIKIWGFKLGFWFAQQGSIYIFVLLIFVYVALMNRLDKKYKSGAKLDKIGTSNDTGAKGSKVSKNGGNAAKTISKSIVITKKNKKNSNY